MDTIHISENKALVPKYIPAKIHIQRVKESILFIFYINFSVTKYIIFLTFCHKCSASIQQNVSTPPERIKQSVKNGHKNAPKQPKTDTEISFCKLFRGFLFHFDTSVPLR